jgi:ketosteroid isomerase-like protein
MGSSVSGPPPPDFVELAMRCVEAWDAGDSAFLQDMLTPDAIIVHHATGTYTGQTAFDKLDARRRRVVPQRTNLTHRLVQAIAGPDTDGHHGVALEYENTHGSRPLMMFQFTADGKIRRVILKPDTLSFYFAEYQAAMAQPPQ